MRLGRSRGRQRVSSRTWGIGLYWGLQVECFWGSQTKVRLVDSNHNSQSFGKPNEGIIQGSARGKWLGARETITRGFGKSCQKRTRGSYPGHALEGETSVSSKPCRLPSHTKQMTRPQYYGIVHRCSQRSASRFLSKDTCSFFGPMWKIH